MRLSQFSRLALLHGLEDWVSLRELGGYWSIDGLCDPARQCDCALVLARELLSTGMVNVGEIDESGFAEWGGEIDELIDRAALNGWSGSNNGWGIDVWFKNTPAGDEQGRRARSELDRRLWSWDEE